MGTMQSQGWFQDMKIPKFSQSFILKENNLNSKIKFERTNREEVSKDQTPRFEKNKILAKAKEVFKWKVFFEKIFF